MFETLLVKPLYNIFVFLIGIMPGGEVGFAILVLTILIRVIFYPVFTASIRLQMGMARIQGEMDEINTKYKDDSTERAKQTLGLYKKHNLRPFAGFLAILVQIPVFIGLYFAFFREGLPNIATDLLYPFVAVPAQVNLNFLGILDLSVSHNLLLAVVVGFLQFLAIRPSIARTKAASGSVHPDKARVQAMQHNLMLYAMPVMYGTIAYTLPAAAGLYFGAMSLISLAQEVVVGRQLEKQK
jgi:YidC/Oxa1 family membrane protein insertase